MNRRWKHTEPHSSSGKPGRKPRSVNSLEQNCPGGQRRLGGGSLGQGEGNWAGRLGSPACSSLPPPGPLTGAQKDERANWLMQLLKMSPSQQTPEQAFFKNRSLYQAVAI